MGKAGPPVAGLFGWPSPHPHRHHCLGGDSLGGSLEEGERKEQGRSELRDSTGYTLAPRSWFGFHWHLVQS